MDGNVSCNSVVVLKHGSEQIWAFVEPLTIHNIIVKGQELFQNLKNLAVERICVLDERGVQITESFLPNYLKLAGNDPLKEFTLQIRPVEPLGGSLLDVNEELNNFEEVYREVENRNEKSIIDKEGLRKLLESSDGGRQILTSYSENKILTEKCRRTLVNICGDALIAHQKLVQRHLHAYEKSSFAKAIIQLFPTSRNPLKKYGYEHFFDPENQSGFIQNFLGNKIRKASTPKGRIASGNSEHCTAPKRRKKTENSQENRNVAETVPQTVDLEDDIEFLKAAVPNENRKQIIDRTIRTFKLRRCMYLNERFFLTFPRFIDLPYLFKVDFDLLFPNKNNNRFCETYPRYVNLIAKLYELEDSILDAAWDRTINTFFYLIFMLPPTARGRKNASREKTINATKKFLVFVETGSSISTPAKEILKRQAPRLKAVGPNRLAITQFFLEVDNTLINLETDNIVEAVDFLFKSFYVLNLEYEEDLKNFFVFIQLFFYQIPSKTSNIVDNFISKLKGLEEAA